MEWEYRITSDFSDIKEWSPEGERVAAGFRPSGELHVGNLVSIAYAAVIASRLGLELDLMCCDTDWSAHIHSHHRGDNSDVMKLFFERECPCGDHRNAAEHRVEEIRPFLRGIEQKLGIEASPGYLTDIGSDCGYVDALESVLQNMEEFDSIFGGGFRRRYRSPVVPVCECGFSHAKGAAYSSETGELVASCRNGKCEKGFFRGSIDERKGVYYLVDPVRDPSRNVAVHVFGGDYRAAEKEQKTPKVSKVARITELATGETPSYFLAPMIADGEGKPLSKSKGTGRTVSDIADLKSYGEKLVSKVQEWIEVEKKHICQDEI